jgi:hypothetical protein
MAVNEFSTYAESYATICGVVQNKLNHACPIKKDYKEYSVYFQLENVNLPLLRLTEVNQYPNMASQFPCSLPVKSSKGLLPLRSLTLLFRYFLVFK